MVTSDHELSAIHRRHFLPWLGRTVPSSSDNTGALAEAHTDDGRVGPLAPFGLPRLAADAGGGADADDDWTKTGTPPLFHDIPSRSANSVLTPANERRSRAHCAGVVISAAKSSRCSAASFARRRAARARARGVVRSCWTGNDLHVGVGIDFDVGLLANVLDSETRSGFGVVRAEDADVDAEMRVDTAREAEGAKDEKTIAASDDIFV